MYIKRIMDTRISVEHNALGYAAQQKKYEYIQKQRAPLFMIEEPISMEHI